MRGTIAPDGTVTITFNMQSEVMFAPGDSKIYLPCNGCGEVLIKEMNVVACLCPNCYVKIKAGDN